MTILTAWSTSADGDVVCEDPVYAYALENNSPKSITARNGTTNYVGQQKIGDFQIFQSFISFDTSSIPAGDTITSVTLSFDVATLPAFVGDTARVYVYDWDTSVTTADYRKGSLLSSLPFVADRGLTNIKVEGPGWVNFTSKTAFKTNINQGGITRLIVGSVKMENNTAPIPGTSYHEVWTFTEGNGSSTGAKLVIEHVDPAGTPTPESLMMGVNF